MKNGHDQAGRAYEAPSITVLGSVSELTQWTGCSTKDLSDSSDGIYLTAKRLPIDCISV